MVVNSSQLNNHNQEQAGEESSSSSPGLEELLKKNIELSEEILKISKKVNNFVIWQKIFGFLKILIIVVPLVLGYYYLLPYFRELQGVYAELLGLSETVQDVGNVNLDPSVIKGLLK